MNEIGSTLQDWLEESYRFFLLGDLFFAGLHIFLVLLINGDGLETALRTGILTWVFAGILSAPVQGLGEIRYSAGDSVAAYLLVGWVAGAIATYTGYASYGNDTVAYVVYIATWATSWGLLASFFVSLWKQIFSKR